MPICELILKYIANHLHTHVSIIVLETAAILLAMAVDFVSGIYKAKQNHKLITSRGLKMTAKKAHKYLSPFSVLTFIDLVAASVVPVPAFSMAYTVYVLCCEYVSIREKAWEKEEIARAAKTMNVALENKDDLVALIVKAVTGEINKQQNNQPDDKPE